MTLIIIIVSVAISLLAFYNGELSQKLRFNAYAIKQYREWYRFLTYGFIHADYIHLLVNMFVLYSFGRVVENYFGILFPGKANFYYIILYVGGILISVAAAYNKHKDNPYYNAVGASGAVSAVVFSSILFQPTGGIRFLFLPFSIPAVVFGILYLVYSAYMAKRAKDNIGHDAHFWGAVFGVVYTIAIKPKIVFYFFEQIKYYLLG
jgi:membrane associated rhomboid family serine protease